MYPQIVIEKRKLIENVKAVVARAQKQHVTITAITKCVAGNVELAQGFVDAGITKLGDSRITNLKSMQHINCEKWLIRIPMLSECCDVVRYSDISLNSELSTIRRLNEEAVKCDKVHGIILMIDVGDLREGFFLGTSQEMSAENQELSQDGYQKIEELVKEVLPMTHIEIKGLGINSTCFGATIPTPETYGQVIRLAEWMERTYGITCEIISGGNSSCYHLFEKGMLPEGVNNMRLGELLLLGQETAYMKALPYLHQDSFELHAELVEIKKKPSYPIGLIGVNSFGETVEFEDKGTRTRAIVAIGKQDVLLEHLKPIDPGITIEGGSSDHMILDITDSDICYGIGDIVRFACDYASVLALSTSSYVESKVI